VKISEVLLQDFDAEVASTRLLLERIPQDKAEFKPHEKSFAFGKLAMHVATLPYFGKMILTAPGMDMKDPKQGFPDTTFRGCDTLMETFTSAADECRAALASVSDEQLEAPWKFSFGEHVISNKPRALSYRLLFFNHLLHHRGQLTTYLRLNDIPVPGLYGPSADEPFNPAK
jgi:uncharacterized damage-inducible protein DinB